MHPCQCKRPSTSFDDPMVRVCVYSLYVQLSSPCKHPPLLFGPWISSATANHSGHYTIYICVGRVTEVDASCKVKALWPIILDTPVYTLYNCVGRVTEVHVSLRKRQRMMSLPPIHVCIIFQEPGYEPGDIIIVLDEQEHPVFTRKGADLYMKQVSPGTAG